MPARESDFSRALKCASTTARISRRCVKRFSLTPEGRLRSRSLNLELAGSEPWVKRLLGGDAPRQKNINDGLSGCLNARGSLGLKLEEISEGESDTANQTNEKELAAVRSKNVVGTIAEGRSVPFHNCGTTSD